MMPHPQEDVRALDRMTFSQWFEGKGGSRGSITRMWDPVAYALGFIDCDHISARCMLTIFQVRGWSEHGYWGCEGWMHLQYPRSG